MRKLFFACLTMGCGLAIPLMSAQDYFCNPQQDYYCAPQQDFCCEDPFDGFYIGGNVGAFSHTAHRNDRDGFLTDNAGWSFVDTNVTAGVLLGYDWQFGSKLVGLVADWNWVNTQIRHRDNPNAPDENFMNSDFDWFTTIRARAGVVVCDALFYLTGGAAVSRIKTTWGDPPVEFEDNHTRWGWTGGVGTEFKLSQKWSLGAEVLFIHFQEHVRSFDSGASTFAFGHSDSAWTGRIILNYRFGDLFSCF